jgi:hypothetical protein
MRLPEITPHFPPTSTTDRDRYNALIEIEENGESHLTSAFKSAFDSADAAATAEQNRPANQRRR